MNDTGLKVRHRKGCNRKNCMDGFAERFRQMILDANAAGIKMREAEFPHRHRKEAAQLPKEKH